MEPEASVVALWKPSLLYLGLEILDASGTSFESQIPIFVV